MSRIRVAQSVLADVPSLPVRVFASYRREDSEGHTGRLCDYLKRAFGASNVFLDVENVHPGDHFLDAIDTAIDECDVALVIIGPRWLNLSASDGTPRLHDPYDVVRHEVSAALRSRHAVIPVLVQDARMPSAADLPDDVAPIARLNALSVSHSRFAYDASRLVERIREITVDCRLEARATRRDELGRSAPPTSFLSHRTAIVAVVVAACAVLLGALGGSSVQLPVWGGIVLVAAGFALRGVGESYHREAAAWARLRQDAALARFRRVLSARLHADDPRLLGPHSIRSLALAVQTEVRSPVITEVHIEETIRSLALEVEETVASPARITLLEKLNRALQELLPGKRTSALLSIAETDPLAAFERASAYGIALGALFLAALGRALFPSLITNLLLSGATAGFVLMLLSLVRTRSYWTRAELAGASKWRRLFAPTKLHPFLDFFSAISVGSGRHHRWAWGCVFAPVWEAPYIMKDPREFLEMHEHRVFEAAPRQDKLATLHERLAREAAAGRSIGQADADEYISLCRDLWTITGKQPYRQMADSLQHRGTLDVEARAQMANRKSLLRSMFESGNLKRRHDVLHRNVLLSMLGQREMSSEELADYVKISRRLSETKGLSESYAKYEQYARHELQRRGIEPVQEEIC